MSDSIPLEEFIGPRKPCPFCGSTDLEMNCWEEYVVCKRCDASAPIGRWQFRVQAIPKSWDDDPVIGPIIRDTVDTPPDIANVIQKDLWELP